MIMENYLPLTWITCLSSRRGHGRRMMRKAKPSRRHAHVFIRKVNSAISRQKLLVENHTAMTKVDGANRVGCERGYANLSYVRIVTTLVGGYSAEQGLHDYLLCGNARFPLKPASPVCVTCNHGRMVTRATGVSQCA